MARTRINSFNLEAAWKDQLQLKHYLLFMELLAIDQAGLVGKVVIGLVRNVDRYLDFVVLAGVRAQRRDRVAARIPGTPESWSEVVHR
jgi:hypothetical protein